MCRGEAIRFGGCGSGLSEEVSPNFVVAAVCAAESTECGSAGGDLSLVLRLAGLARSERDGLVELAAPVLGAVLDASGSRDISDIQVRMGSPMFIHTKDGIERLAEFGVVTAELASGFLLTLMRSRSRRMDAVDPDAGERDELAKFLARRSWDFGTAGRDHSPSAVIESGRQRIQAFFFAGGLGLTIRVLRDEVTEFGELGIGEAAGAVMRRAADLRGGIGLVTGPTGSGKSTTLAALVEWLKCNREKHIVTVEDPIEYRFSNAAGGAGGNPGYVTQQEVGDDVSSFAQGLRDFLRKRGDVLVVGEIRDREQFEMAYEAAMTGHLVLSTMHTESASRSVGRIADLVPPELERATLNMLSNSLVFIMSQVLVPGLQQQRRVLAYELFHNASEASRAAIRQYPGNPTKLEELVGQDGGQRLNDHLLALFREGRISADVMRANWLNLFRPEEVFR